ncbi:threonine dehydrogenase-like Zn-dependent dehydrogenase [Achromobacter deleyi]|nr:threonine dehydrogenase-like Zn-dependent dehydrogenase [Achromobacter deleyi]
MKALCRHGKHDVRYDTVPDPILEDPRDANFKVSACAICGSDLHLFDGFMPGMKSGDIGNRSAAGSARNDLCLPSGGERCRFPACTAG